MLSNCRLVFGCTPLSINYALRTNFKMIIKITLNMDNFAGEGDVNLFGEMLHHFFALYADIHLFNQLTLVLQPTGKRLRWRENHSQQIPG